MNTGKTAMLRPRALFRGAGAAGLLIWLAAVPERAPAQSVCFGGDPQHSGVYKAPAQHLNQVRWSAKVSLTNFNGFGHFGAPIITSANTVVQPVRTQSGFRINAFDGATGRLKYTLTTDYVLPSYDWLPAYQPVLAGPPSGARLYYPGEGGTVYYITNPDSDAPGTPVQQCFYADLADYQTNADAFRQTVFINTALTADTNGNIFFGFRIATNGAPAPLSTTNGGIARLDPDGKGIYVLANDAAGDPRVTRVPHNCAPALSNDGTILYATVSEYLSDNKAASKYNYLLGLDSTSLAKRYAVLLTDGPLGSRLPVSDNSTAAPVIGPDGDVYFGVSTGGNGLLLHFSSDLARQMPPGAFGWDNTPAIVPASMVPEYSGNSSYLLFSKYNDYGLGIHRIALLDPNATQQNSNRMREVLTAIGCTPHPSVSGSTYAVHEWCINAAAVNPPTHSVFMPNEDGRLYRWDLVANSLSEAFSLEPAVSEGYVPTAIGPDGTVYTLGNQTLFACGSLSNLVVTMTSSQPDLRHTVVGQTITFTANISSLAPLGPTPTGTVSFTDSTYNVYLPTNQVLAANLPLSNGTASVTTTALTADSNVLGNHFITAVYSGDSNYPPATSTLVQKVHASGTSLTIDSVFSASNLSAVLFTATVSPQQASTTLPRGMVSFWDGSTLVAQLRLDLYGTVTYTNSNFIPGLHALSATYASDTVFADSSGAIKGAPPAISASLDPATGAVLLAFTNFSGALFSVLSAEDLSTPPTAWTWFGPVIETAPGQYQSLLPPTKPLLFYRVRSP